MKSLRIVLPLLALVGLFVVFGLLPRIRNQQELKAAVNEERNRIPIVNAVPLMSAGDSTGLTLPGQIQPYRETPLYARTQGFLRKRLVDIGATVQQGQLLATLDVPELEQDLARARADLQLAQSNLARVTSVNLPGAVAKQDIDNRRTAVAVSEANLRRLQTLRSLQEIRAPFGGIITARNVEIGDLISPNSQRALFTIAQMDRLRVFVDVPQAYYQQVRVGQSATVTVPELKERAFVGTVTRTSGALRSDSRTLLTEVTIPNPNRTLPAGLYGQVTFSFSGDAGAPSPVRLPANALKITPDGPRVYVVQPNMRLKITPVTLGRDYGTTIEVTSGLTGTERVVTNPNDRLKDGQQVQFKPKKPQAT